MRFLLADESLVVRETTVMERLEYVSRSMAFEAASSLMESAVSSDFLLRAFTKGYMLPAYDGCVSCQVWLSSKKSV